MLKVPYLPIYPAGLVSSPQPTLGSSAPELVIGREAETQELLKLLEQGVGVMLLGDHGVGKSFLVRHVLRQLGAPTTSVSLSTATSGDGVLSALCGALGVSTAEVGVGAVNYRAADGQAGSRVWLSLQIFRYSSALLLLSSGFIPKCT